MGRDRGLPFAHEAGEVIPLSAEGSAEPHLDGDLLIALARRSGADALHPGCPCAGRIAPREAADLAARLRDLGAGEISLADTTGAADPSMADRLLDEVESRRDLGRAALHLHDTCHRALA